MGDYKAQELIKNGDKLFSSRGTLETHWQEAAEHFYPERADFTVQRTMGDTLTDHLTTSYPMIARRELGNMYSSMLRPRSQNWFRISVGERDLDSTAKSWLDASATRLRNAMYDPATGFVRATKECDQDYVTFGQGVLRIEMDWKGMTPLVRSRHLKDVVWRDGYNGLVNEVHERWHATAHELLHVFAENKLHKEIINAAKKQPDKKFECRHIVLPTDKYERLDVSDKVRKDFPYVSIYVDVENCAIIEEVPSRTLKYVIPRWQTVSGSQYSYSQAVIAALPDARLLQSMSLTLLEAGENYARPPMLAVQEALRSDLNLFSGGVTFVSRDYDERLGEALRPLSQDKGGFGAGIEMLDRTRVALQEAFFLNKLNLPQMGDMTAFETSQRVQEYIRNVMPLFEPVEMDYNAPLSEMLFNEMYSAGFFGRELPVDLQGADLKFKFENPLYEIEEKQKAESFIAARNLIDTAAPLDQSATAMLNVRDALRDAMSGINIPSDWVLEDDEIDQMMEEAKQQQQSDENTQKMMQGADMMEKLGKAQQAMAASNE